MRALLYLALIMVGAGLARAEPVIIGSKKFTESYVLSEIAKRLVGETGTPVEHRQGMGGTIILWEALRSGQISAYPEYTGTIAEEILKMPANASAISMREGLQAHGVGMTGEIGFNNTYALVMRREAARRLGLRSISDLRSHPGLRFGLTHEFINRRDGWEPLRQRYELSPASLRGIDHGLGYAALMSGAIDLKDAYSTDAKIAQNDLVTLSDDRNFFPQYKAVFLYRLEATTLLQPALQKLEGAIDEVRMIRLNAEAEESKNYEQAANLFFQSGTGTPAQANGGFPRRLLGWTVRHLELVGSSLLLAIVVGVPLGIWASRGGAVGGTIMSVVGVVQTIPSLALLALLVPVPFFGISARTAIAALFLYGLLPIVRNTATGLQDIAQPIRDSAVALGLSPAAQLRQIYLPIASRTILAGIKTSAVINVGTATLAALIGAGGLGEPIISGLNLNDHATILQGAIPAAILALLVQWSFTLLDRVLIPRGLRL